ncbi:MAG: tRNA pseudouridine(55) synthase TruB [Acidobacteriota bacterium]
MINGMVLIRKNKGLTSHDVVKKVKSILGVKKAGHFGTLDPLAQGLLLVGVGNATKFFDFLVGRNKTYSGIIKFGYSTTTYDNEGEQVGKKNDIDLFGMNLVDLLKDFRGKILQYPPKYSAKKYNGIPLYKYARKDMDVEIKPVGVEIFSLETEILEKDLLKFRAVTSSGTYLRSLAHDIGEAAGSGAFLQELTREAVGEFDLEDALTLDELEVQMEKGEKLQKGLIPIEMLLTEFPRIVVSQNGSETVKNGAMLSLKDILEVSSGDDSNNYRIFDDDGNLLAIAKKDSVIHRFKPFIVFNNKS